MAPLIPWWPWADPAGALEAGLSGPWACKLTPAGWRLDASADALRARLALADGASGPELESQATGGVGAEGKNPLDLWRRNRDYYRRTLARYDGRQ